VLPPGICGPVLRFHPACPFGKGVKHPCLIALCRNVLTDHKQAIQRTALNPDGTKLVGKARMALGPTRGAAIKLSADEDVAHTLTIGEGLETTIAGMMRGFAPAWSLIDADNIGMFPVLPGIECLGILVDNDAVKHGRRAGQEAALACSKRWTAAGREVRRIIPRGVGQDMADLIEGAA
jgi:hypothetical protein